MGFVAKFAEYPAQRETNHFSVGEVVARRVRSVAHCTGWLANTHAAQCPLVIVPYLLLDNFPGVHTMY